MGLVKFGTYVRTAAFSYMKALNMEIHTIPLDQSAPPDQFVKDCIQTLKPLLLADELIFGRIYEEILSNKGRDFVQKSFSEMLSISEQESLKYFLDKYAQRPRSLKTLCLQVIRRETKKKEFDNKNFYHALAKVCPSNLEEIACYVQGTIMIGGKLPFRGELKSPRKLGITFPDSGNIPKGKINFTLADRL